jgi:hypothetical protein
MEDISHILNNGEVPELFSKDEKAKYIEEMENASLDKGGNKKKRINAKIDTTAANNANNNNPTEEIDNANIPAI